MTSFLYHAFGIIGYYYLRTIFEGGKVFFGIDQEKHRLRCSACSSKNVKRRGKTKRRFQSLPIGGKQTFIDFEIPRVECRDCGLVRQVKVGFANARRTYTRPFERYALELSKHMTISDVADHLGISWDIAKDIQKRRLTKRYKSPRLKHIRQIAIDEICIGKGHQYLTVVLDLSSGAVVYVVPERKPLTY
jgi:transposase